MATPITLYTKGGSTPEAVAPKTVASQVEINDENGSLSTVDAEIVLLRQKVSAVADAGVHFKGALTSASGLPTVGYKAGWQYIVQDAGTYAGNACEVGDLVLCISDYASGSASNKDWAVLQANLTGTMSGPSSAVAGNVVVFDGTSGALVKDSGIQVLKSVPADAVFTDHIYDPVTAEANGLMTPAMLSKFNSIEVSADVTDAANVSAAGAFMKATDNADSIADGTTKKLMTATERSKLSGIAAGAEVNQNAFSSVKVGSVTLTADSKTDTLEIAAGDGITVTPDETGDKVTLKETYIDSCVVNSLDAVPANLRDGGLIILRG